MTKSKRALCIRIILHFSQQQKYAGTLIECPSAAQLEEYPDETIKQILRFIVNRCL